MLKMLKAVPKTKMITKSLDISDIKPHRLSAFITVHGIPENAHFNGVDNAYDGWEVGHILLSWEVEAPTTREEQSIFKRKRFTHYAWDLIYKVLLANNYTRTGCCSSHFKKYKGTTVYDMFLNSNWDRLEEYYAPRFQKGDT